MFKTILFDLDGTLLDIDMDVFIPKYFKMISAKFSHLIEPHVFIEHLLYCTRLMIADKDPQKTNEEVFMNDFIPRIGISREELQPLLIDFYTNDFGQLNTYTRREPLARKIMDWAFFKGYEVVIATNPVFPHLAIGHRLHWAGIEDYSYSLITTYENMHFCKPHLEYYEEILSILGRKPEECLMMGNDVEEDLSAGTAGIKTYLVENFILNKREDSPPPADYFGYLDDFYRFMQGWQQPITKR
ncbi:MAG: HAD family hydrolase [Bacillota bacterium]|nr:HAD family hydrolase [Bacillota bacterium]